MATNIYNLTLSFVSYVGQGRLDQFVWDLLKLVYFHGVLGDLLQDFVLGLPARLELAIQIRTNVFAPQNFSHCDLLS
jgi:hypothetical protein